MVAIHGGTNIIDARVVDEIGHFLGLLRSYISMFGDKTVHIL